MESQSLEHLTAQNYKRGFLVDDETIAGVTEMANGVGFAAYVSNALTGETLAYAEFDTLEPALAYLADMPRQWTFEAVGCGGHDHDHEHSSHGHSHSSCGGGDGCGGNCGCK